MKSLLKKVNKVSTNNKIGNPQKMLCIYSVFFLEIKFTQMKLPERSAMIDGLRIKLPLSRRKGKKFSPGLAQKNDLTNSY